MEYQKSKDMLIYSALNSTFLAVYVTLVMAGDLVLVPTVAIAQHGYAQKPVPYGLVATIRNDPSERLDPKPFLNPYISGVALQINWSDIEPVQGNPDWDRLDELFAAAQFLHKFVHLYVFAGFFSPAWALAGAEQGLFKVPYGPGAGNYMNLPMPYDPVYLANWFAFVKQMSARYGDRPEFLMIGAAGPTSVSEEMTEPMSPADIVKWQTHHYTSTKYIEAWQRTFETYAKYFPNQYVSLSHGNGVPINAEGMPDPQEPTRTRQDVVGDGWSILGAQFAFQSSALTGDAHREQVVEMVISYSGLAVTGFLLASSCLHFPRNRVPR
jgi:hypothetical protein